MEEKDFSEPISDSIIRQKLIEMSNRDNAEDMTLLRSNNEDRYVKDKDKFQHYVLGIGEHQVYAVRVSDKLYFYRGQGQIEGKYQLSRDDKNAVNHEESVPREDLRLGIEH